MFFSFHSWLYVTSEQDSLCFFLHAATLWIVTADSLCFFRAPSLYQGTVLYDDLDCSGDALTSILPQNSQTVGLLLPLGILCTQPSLFLQPTPSLY